MQREAQQRRRESEWEAKQTVQTAGGEEAILAADKLVSSAMANPKTRHLVPLTSRAVDQTTTTLKDQCAELMRAITAPLPTRTRFRKSLVHQMCNTQGRLFNVKEVEEITGVCEGYVRSTMRKDRQVDRDGTKADPLYSEKISGPSSLKRTTVAAAEEEVILEWARLEMVVRSGTHTETFRLQEQKQQLIERFNADYPRLLRKVVGRDPTLRARLDGSSHATNMTIFQRNIERSIWLAQQPGFEEGPQADEQERERIKARLAAGWHRGRVEKCTAVQFDPSTWQIVHRHDLWFWGLLRKNKMRFRLDHTPYECDICLRNTPADLKKVEEDLLKPGTTTFEMSKLQQEKRKLMRRRIQEKIHVRQKENQRPYNIHNIALLLQHNPKMVKVTADFGASYLIDGGKIVSLILFLTYVDESGATNTECLYNIVTDKDQRSEDAFYVRSVWHHHLTKSGVFDRWDTIILVRDSGPHFQNNNIVWFESTIFELYEKEFLVSAFAKRHGFNECDGALARFIRALRDAALGGDPPKDAEDAARIINTHEKFANCTAYFWSVIDRNPSLFPEKTMTKFAGIQAGQFCEFCYDYTDYDGTVVRDPGWVRARPLSGMGRWTIHDFQPKSRPAAWGTMCKDCSNRSGRPIFHKRPEEPIKQCQTTKQPRNYPA